MDLRPVARWAESSGLRLRTGTPADNTTLDLVPPLLGPLPGPHGETFEVPDGLRAFWHRYGGARVEQDENDEYPWFIINEFWIFSSEELVDLTARWVRLPADVSHGDRRITNDHLVGFACAGDIRQRIWCFDTAERTANGEYPIVAVHHESDARFTDTGERITDFGPGRLEYVAFDDWLDAYIEDVCGLERDDLLGLA